MTRIEVKHQPRRVAFQRRARRHRSGIGRRGFGNRGGSNGRWLKTGMHVLGTSIDGKGKARDVQLDGRDDSMKGRQAFAFEGLALRPVNCLQVNELLLAEWVEVGCQHLQAGLFAMIEVAYEPLPTVKLGRAGSAVTRPSIEPGRSVDPVAPATMVGPGSRVGKGSSAVIAKVGNGAGARGSTRKRWQVQVEAVIGEASLPTADPALLKVRCPSGLTASMTETQPNIRGGSNGTKKGGQVPHKASRWASDVL